MRQTPLYACWTIAFVSACAGGADSAASTRSGLRASDSDEVEACADAEPDEAPVGEGEDTCLFGEVFSDIRTNEALVLTNETWIDSAEALTELEAAQLVLAVQQSSHTDVSTAAEALERVDEQQVRRVDFYEVASERWFVAYEYGAGDNSYGAIFDSDGINVLASIHDGDLSSCTVMTTPLEDPDE